MNKYIGRNEKIISKAKRMYIRLGGKKAIRLIAILKYYRRCGKIPDLANPKTIGEKIIWIKLNYYNPLYEICADKIAVRKYVKEKLREAGFLNEEEYFPELYKIYDRAEDIDLSELPSSFVLKPNHSSGLYILCSEKVSLNETKVVEQAKKWLKENFYYEEGEWQYKNIIPKIICEELLDEEIVDYRIFCFDGKPAYVKVTKHGNDDGGNFTNYYDIEWEKLGCEIQGYKMVNFEKPDKWEEMLKIATALSKDFFFVRVDLYETNNRVYFAELTFTPNNGLAWLIPEKFNEILGNMMHLPKLI